VSFGLEELKTQGREYRTLDQHDQLVDLNKEGHRHFQLGKDLQQIRGVFVCLGEQAKRKHGDCIVTPRLVDGGEEHLSVFGLEVLQPFAEICELGRRNQDHVELDHHKVGELQVLFPFQDLGKGPKDPLGIHVQAQLAYDEASPGFEQTSIRAEQLEKVDQEAAKVAIFRVCGDLGKQLEIVFDDLL